MNPPDELPPSVRIPWVFALTERLPPAVVAIADQAVVSASTFLVMICAARVLRTDEYGLFTLLWLSGLFLEGVYSAIVVAPIAVLLPEKVGTERGDYLAALLATGVRVWVGVIIVGAITGATIGDWALGMAFACMCLARMSVELCRRIGYALHNSPLALFVDGIFHAPVLCLACAAYVVRPQLRPTWVFAWLAVFGCVAFAIVAHRLWCAYRRERGGYAANSFHRAHWTYGRWVLAHHVTTFGAGQTYVYLVAGMLGLKETALFAASRSLGGLCHPFLQGIDAYAVPRLRARLLAGGIDAFLVDLRRVALLMSLVMLPFCTLLIVFPGELISWFIDPKYRDGGWILACFGVLYATIAISRTCNIGLMAMKRPQAGFVATSVGTVGAILFGASLISTLGLRGAVYGILGNGVVFVVVAVCWLVISVRDQKRAAEGVVGSSVRVQSESERGR